MATGKELKGLAAKLQQSAAEVKLPPVEIDPELLETAEMIIASLANVAFLEMVASKDPFGQSIVHIPLAEGVRDDLPGMVARETVLLQICKRGGGQEITEGGIAGRVNLNSNMFLQHPKCYDWKTSNALRFGITRQYSADGYSFVVTSFEKDGSWTGYLERTLTRQRLATSHGSRLKEIIERLSAEFEVIEAEYEANILAGSDEVVIRKKKKEKRDEG